MAKATEKELQQTEKRELADLAEQIRPGLTFTPAVDILETEKAIIIMADLPGVKPDDLKIDLRENVLTLSADVSSPEAESEAEVLREFRYGGFYRQFRLSDTIDQEKIEAKLQDGVLRLELPKIEAAQPRRIAVKAG